MSARQLAATLTALERHLRRFVWFPKPEQSVAIALWIAHTHAMAAVEQSPILAISSPVKQSGKSRLLEVLEAVVPTPWRIERPSEAVLFRRIARDAPTVLLDEVDTVFMDRNGQFEGLRAIYNAGNRRGTVVSRVVPKGKTFELADFPIFCPKAVAGIGRFPETLIDRSIVIAMSRRAPGERIERLRARTAEALGLPLREALADQLAAVDDLTLPDELLPAALDDRGQDNWEALLAIARLAGGEWPELAARAAVALQADRQTADDNAAVTLLGDLAGILTEDRPFVSTSEIIEELTKLDSSPWAEWTHGKPISARGIARLLAPFGIAPERVRSGSGYSRRQFIDAWSRYCAVPSPSEELQQLQQVPPHEAPARAHVALVAVVADAPRVEVARDGNGAEGTVWSWDAPLCETCGRRMRAVLDRPGRHVCTFPHRLDGGTAEAAP
jgi:hypothetical protein